MKFLLLASCFEVAVSGLWSPTKISWKYSSSWYNSLSLDVSSNSTVTVEIAASKGGLESASATTFVLPGQYLTSKLCACRVSNHWACLLDKLFCDLIYSSDAWSVMAVNFCPSKYGCQ